jgi:hypothetical protein
VRGERGVYLSVGEEGETGDLKLVCRIGSDCSILFVSSVSCVHLV